jgi:hypothetical protein
LFTNRFTSAPVWAHRCSIRTAGLELRTRLFLQGSIEFFGGVPAAQGQADQGLPKTRMPAP